MAERLPELVRTYLARSLPADATARRPCGSATGRMWRKLGGRAMPFQATEDFGVDRVGYSWRARFPIVGPLAMAVVDELADGPGRPFPTGRPLSPGAGAETSASTRCSAACASPRRQSLVGAARRAGSSTGLRGSPGSSWSVCWLPEPCRLSAERSAESAQPDPHGDDERRRRRRAPCDEGRDQVLPQMMGHDHWKISVVQSPFWSRTSCVRAGPSGRLWKSTKKSRSISMPPFGSQSIRRSQERRPG
jgi:hypothetical protein